MKKVELKKHLQGSSIYYVTMRMLFNLLNTESRVPLPFAEAKAGYSVNSVINRKTARPSVISLRQSLGRMGHHCPGVPERRALALLRSLKSRKC